MSARVTALVWGVKESFRGYVQAVGGTMAAADGATLSETGEFEFQAAADSTLALGADGVLTGVGRFSGMAQFEAHGGMLSVHLGDPVVEIGPEGGSLTLDDPRTGRVEIAKLNLAGGTDEGGWWVIPTALAMHGSYALGGHYAAMTPIDPVRLKVETA